MEDILELAISGIGEVNGDLVIVEDYLSDYKYSIDYTEMVEKLDNFVVMCNSYYGKPEWENFMNKDFKTEIFPIL